MGNRSPNWIIGACAHPTHPIRSLPPPFNGMRKHLDLCSHNWYNIKSTYVCSYSLNVRRHTSTTRTLLQSTSIYIQDTFIGTQFCIQVPQKCRHTSTTRTLLHLYIQDTFIGTQFCIKVPQKCRHTSTTRTLLHLYIQDTFIGTQFCIKVPQKCGHL